MSVIASQKRLKAFKKWENFAPYIGGMPIPDVKKTPLAILRRAKQGRFMGKHLRPWSIIPPDTILDKSKVWVGFEYETGYNSHHKYLEAVNWFGKAIQNGCFDPEGSGRNPVEFTFFPVELDKLEFKSGPSTMIRYARKNPPASHTTSYMVGTHANISTPLSRAGRGQNLLFINSATWLLNSKERLALFGRSRLYRSDPVWQGKHWEFKYFNTTYDMRVWLGYCLVVRKLVDFILRTEAGETISPQRAADELKSIIPEVRKLHAKKRTYAMTHNPLARARNRKEKQSSVLQS